MVMIRIAVEHISKVFDSGGDRTAAVDDVSLTVSPGELFFLLGPSGCGKTTLLRMIAGLIEPTAGRLFFGDRDVTDEPIERRGTALVFQNYALWPHMTVAANVAFGPRMQGVPRAARRELVNRNLELVQMANLARRKPKQLSGGQQQRVALARALAARPACLLLDEPLSNLDAQLRLQMREEIRELVKATGTTAIYVTHDQKEALSMGDRIAVMRSGRVVQVGTPAAIYERPVNSFVAAFIGEANFLAGTVVAVGQKTVTVETPAGRLEGAADRILNPGEPVTCCLRPELIRLTKRQPEAREQTGFGLV